MELTAANGEQASALGSELMQDYTSTPYAGLAALYLAKGKYENGNVEEAAGMLRWALENSDQPGIRHPARLRLARILLEQDKVDEAAKLAEVEDHDGFASEYQELRGDIAMSRGDAKAARSAYEEALREMTPGSPYSTLLTAKLDSAAGSSSK